MRADLKSIVVNGRAVVKEASDLITDVRKDEDRTADNTLRGKGEKRLGGRDGVVI